LGNPSAASAAICSKVGGLNLACANFITASMTCLFLVTSAPIRAPHAEYFFIIE